MADELDITEVIKHKSGAELFRELKRQMTTAMPEDYYKYGAWMDDLMKLDIQLLEAHRAEAGAPDAPPLSEIPQPKLPEPKARPMAGAAGAALVRPLAGLGLADGACAGWPAPMWAAARMPQLMGAGTSPMAAMAQTAPAAALAAALMARAAQAQGQADATASTGAAAAVENPGLSKAGAMAAMAAAAPSGEMPSLSKAAALAATAVDPQGAKRSAEEQGGGPAKQPKAGFSKAASVGVSSAS